VNLVMDSRQVDGRMIIAVTGELDVHTAAQLEQALKDNIEAGQTDIVLDLTGLGFLDSTGLGVMVKGLKWAKDSGGGLQVIADDAKIVKVFTITGLDVAMSLQPDLREAGLE
jgi:anti-sigma B factor antagonist